MFIFIDFTLSMSIVHPYSGGLEAESNGGWMVQVVPSVAVHYLHRRHHGIKILCEIQVSNLHVQAPLSPGSLKPVMC